MDDVKFARVYHFCNSKYGLENIKNQRLKIANVMELNDPFELLFCEMTDKAKRDGVKSLKASFAKEFGFLCFSRSYSSPVQWAHYGDKHNGICLGFDISVSKLLKISYVAERKGFHNGMFSTQGQALKWLIEFLTTKHSSWSYEREMRMLCRLLGSERVGDLYFAKFSELMQLKQVIIGCNSKVSGVEVRTALGGNLSQIDVFKARPAFSKFEIVRDKSVCL
nr:DUF2971 domain-containing protein [uncultured Pseudomonas sp.]